MIHSGHADHISHRRQYLLLALCSISLLTGCSVHHSRGTVPISPPIPGVPSLFTGPVAQLGKATTLKPHEIKVTATGNSMSLVFDNAVLDPSPDGPDIVSWNASLRFKVDPALAKDVKTIRHHVRFFLMKEKDARVVLLYHLNGKPFVEEFPYQMIVDGEKANMTKEFDVPFISEENTGFSTNIYMWVERRSKTANVSLHLDSVDIIGLTGKEQSPK